MQTTHKDVADRLNIDIATRPPCNILTAQKAPLKLVCQVLVKKNNGLVF